MIVLEWLGIWFCVSVVLVVVGCIIKAASDNTAHWSDVKQHFHSPGDGFKLTLEGGWYAWEKEKKQPLWKNRIDKLREAGWAEGKHPERPYDGM